MNLEKLKEKIYNSSYPLDDLLLEVRWIAKKRENKAFLNWIDNELNGYDNNDAIPEYRILINTVLSYTATNGYGSVLKSNISTQILKAKKNNEKEFINHVSNLKINNGLADIQACALKVKEFGIIPEQGFSYLIDEFLSGCFVQSFYIPMQASRYKTILNSIRILLQNFIEELDEISDWEGNDLSSRLMDKTFNIVVNKTINNYSNNIGEGNNNVINTGNNNTITSTYNENFIKDCIDIVNSINAYSEDIEKLKLEIIEELNKSKKVEDKSSIIKKIKDMILAAAAFGGDVATGMPLFTTLLKYFKESE